MYGYNFRPETYLVNETITTADGCNSCLCTTRGALCTKVECNNAGFGKFLGTYIYTYGIVMGEKMKHLTSI